MRYLTLAEALVIGEAVTGLDGATLARTCRSALGAGQSSYRPLQIVSCQDLPTLERDEARERVDDPRRPHMDPG